MLETIPRNCRQDAFNMLQTDQLAAQVNACMNCRVNKDPNAIFLSDLF